jgi:hypothetical protein
MLSPRIAIAVILSSAWMLSAQSQPSAQPPIGVKPVPSAAQGRTAPQNIPPLLQQYDFSSQLRTLEDSGSLPNDVKPETSRLARRVEPCRKTSGPNGMCRCRRQRSRLCA